MVRTLFVAGDPMAATGQTGSPPPPPGILFTQHLMPDGRTQPQWIERPDHVTHRAGELIELGFSFHSEMLRDYVTCSFTIEHPAFDHDLACEIAPNGPAVLDAIDRLIMDFQPPAIIPGGPTEEA